MSEAPPPYANYPRNAPTYGSAAQLQSLYDGYRLYSWVFLANIVLGFVIFFGAGASGSPVVVALAYPVTAAIFGFISHPLNKKIGYGAHWSSSQIIVASVLMGLNSVTCGIIGYVIIQSIAMSHIKKYGLKSGVFGVSKKNVQQRILELQAAGNAGSPY